MNRHPLCLALLVLAPCATAAQHYGPWSNPIPAPGINTEAAEGCPIEAPDGRHLYFMSTRPGGQGSLDNWRARWNVARAQWDHVENLGPVANSPAADYCPTPLRGRRLLFVSARQNSEDCDGCKAMPPPPPGSPPHGDLFLTVEKPGHGWATPVHLGSYAEGGPNTRGSEYSPSLVHTHEGSFLFFSSNGYPDSKGHDIYMSRQRPDGSFEPGVRVAELSSDAADLMPNVRSDGLEIVFSSNRASSDPRDQDIWYATRPDTAMPWTLQGRIPNPRINTDWGAETRATLSADGTRLYFGRKRYDQVPADPGDVYVSLRPRAWWRWP